MTDNPKGQEFRSRRYPQFNVDGFQLAALSSIIKAIRCEKCHRIFFGMKHHQFCGECD